MSTIKFKRSSVSGKIPLVGDLDYGEMALNYADGVLYYKNSSNAIASLSSGGTFNTSTLVALAVTATTISAGTTATTQVGFATNILGGTAGQLVYQTASGATGFLSTTTLTVAAAVTATNALELIGGAVGSIPYQISPNVTDFIAIGQNGYVLTSNGSTATWQASSGGTASLGTIVTTAQGWNLP
jgi:hypothetical protein